MISVRFVRVAILLLVFFFAFLLGDSSERVPDPQPSQAVGATPLNGTIVYVSDFELDIFRTGVFRMPRRRPSAATTASPASPKTAAGGPLDQSARTSSPPAEASAASPPQISASSPAARPRSSSADLDTDEERLNRANELIEAMAQNVVRGLQTYGYEAHRLRWNQPRPEKGLLIRGVFAEPDDRNRARRLLFGGPSTAPKMMLYVGINNLKDPEQPLYVLTDPPNPDSRYGPVITVTSYSPAARFELGKNPGPEEIKRIATQIASDFSDLLSANPLLSTQ